MSALIYLLIAAASFCAGFGLAALALELQANDRRDHDPGDEDRSQFTAPTGAAAGRAG